MIFGMGLLLSSTPILRSGTVGTAQLRPVLDLLTPAIAVRVQSEAVSPVLARSSND